MSQQENQERPDRNTLAEQRTSYARGRSLYAAERTFAAWIRTGFSISGAGVTLATALQNTASRDISLIMGAILILTGIMTFAYALFEYFKSYRFIRDIYNADEIKIQSFRINFVTATVLSTVLILVSLMGLIMIIF